MTVYVKVKILLILILLIGMSVLSGQAQDQRGLRELVRLELERTDQLIDRAREMASQSDNKGAVEVVAQAGKLQQQAWDAFNASQYANASKLTRLARELLRSAVAISRGTEQSGDHAQKRIERAQDRMDRAKEVLDNGGCEQLKGLYDAATANLNRAWEFYRKNENRPAVKLANQVEDIADRILEKCGSSAGQSGQFESRRENVSGLIEQAKQVVTSCDDAKAKSHLDQAEKSFDMADELYASGRIDAAFLSLRRARESAVRATQICQGSDRLTQRLEQLKSQVDATRGQAGDLTGQTGEIVNNLLTQAADQLKQARTQIDAGRTEAALASLQAAQLALRQAQSYIGEHK
jgi:HEPN domain-containing protein